MSVRTLLSVVTCGATALGLGAAPAGASVVPRVSAFAGAGYVLTAPDQVSMDFRVPAVTCSAHDQQSSLRAGAYAPTSTHAWHAIVALYCGAGTVTRSLVIGTRQGGAQEGGAGIAAAGHVIKIALSRLQTSSPIVSIQDADVRGSKITQHLDLATDVAVGADGTPVTPFAAFSPHVTVNSGLPFAKIPHTRRDETRDGVVLIKAGNPSTDGAHFQLKFKHR